MKEDLVTHGIDTTTMTDILIKLGITDDDKYNLILWNDHVNSMDYVALALYEICFLSPDECIKIMLKAHKNDKALVTSGTEAEMLDMKKKMNERHIEVTIEQ